MISSKLGSSLVQFARPYEACWTKNVYIFHNHDLNIDLPCYGSLAPYSQTSLVSGSGGNWKRMKFVYQLWRYLRKKLMTELTRRGLQGAAMSSVTIIVMYEKGIYKWESMIRKWWGVYWGFIIKNKIHMYNDNDALYVPLASISLREVAIDSKYLIMLNPEGCCLIACF